MGINLQMSNHDLIEKALSVVNPQKVGAYTIGDVGCALLTDTHMYLGVCIDVSSSMGFCAEHSAIAAMVTAGEFRIKKIVAVWKNGSEVRILSPCGRCREFIRQLHKDNLQTEVILAEDKVLKLSELLPYHDWWHQHKIPIQD
jgi:cytidine deaminase